VARKKQEDPPMKTDGWMATFSDLMNLLLCFFVMLFAMSNVDEEKYQQLVASLNSTLSFFEGGGISIGEGLLLGNGVSQLNELDAYINNIGKTADSANDSEDINEFDSAGRLKELSYQEALQAIEAENLKANEILAERITEAIDESKMSDKIEVTFNSQYVQLSLKGALLFDSGKTDVKKDATEVLDRIGLILERYANDIIEIEGHTDNVPINTAQYPNNNVLSSARALAVFDYLVDTTLLNPSNIKHSGRGEYDPIADNSTESGRASNRRVEIRIYNNAD